MKRFPSVPLGSNITQHAAYAYDSQIDLAGSSTETAQQLRRDWTATIDPLVATGSLVVKKVTSKALESILLAELPTPLDMKVDAMLHELGYIKSELALGKGYAKGLSSRRVNGKGQSPPTLSSDNFKIGVC